jgi:hypothetical protein
MVCGGLLASLCRSRVLLEESLRASAGLQAVALPISRCAWAVISSGYLIRTTVNVLLTLLSPEMRVDQALGTCPATSRAGSRECLTRVTFQLGVVHQ